LPTFQRPLAVNRATDAIYHATEQVGTDLDGERFEARYDNALRSDPSHVAERHEQRTVSPEPHNLGPYWSISVPRMDVAHVADGHRGTRRLDHEPDHLRYLAVDRD